MQKWNETDRAEGRTESLNDWTEQHNRKAMQTQAVEKGRRMIRDAEKETDMIADGKQTECCSRTKRNYENNELTNRTN